MARIRSPNYPQIELHEAVQHVRKIFNSEGRNFAPREVVAELLGYSSVSGASDKKVSGITAYGLLERNSDRELSVSDLAMRVLHPEDKREEAEALAEAAMKPNLFQEIDERWPDTPPSDFSLRSYLIRRGFNQNAVEQVIRVYRSALSYVDAATTEPDSPEEVRDESANASGRGQTDAEADVDSTVEPKPVPARGKPIVFDMETISGEYSFDNADDLADFIEKLERIKPLLPSKQPGDDDLV